MRTAIDITNQKFGRLLVVSRASNTSRNAVTWNCLCDCGREKIVAGRHLRSGVTVSCGCFAAESTKIRSTTHGMTGTRTHKIWAGMKQRCGNPKSPEFYLYGGRGISVCDRWKNSFETFLADMGEAPQGKSIDRIDVDRGYSPENCRWANDFQQANNTRRNRLITANGETMTHTQWSVALGGNPNLVYLRIRAGWDCVVAATTPVMKRR